MRPRRVALCVSVGALALALRQTTPAFALPPSVTPLYTTGDTSDDSRPPCAVEFPDELEGYISTQIDFTSPRYGAVYREDERIPIDANVMTIPVLPEAVARRTQLCLRVDDDDAMCASLPALQHTALPQLHFPPTDDLPLNNPRTHAVTGWLQLLHRGSDEELSHLQGCGTEPWCPLRKVQEIGNVTVLDCHLDQHDSTVFYVKPGPRTDCPGTGEGKQCTANNGPPLRLLAPMNRSTVQRRVATSRGDSGVLIEVLVNSKLVMALALERLGTTSPLQPTITLEAVLVPLWTGNEHRVSLSLPSSGSTVAAATQHDDSDSTSSGDSQVLRFWTDALPCGPLSIRAHVAVTAQVESPAPIHVLSPTEEVVVFVAAGDGGRSARRHGECTYAHEDMLVVTGADEGYMDRLRNLVGSLHFWAPRNRILVYDLGLHPVSQREVDSWTGAERRELPWTSLPNHVQPSTAWKVGWKPFAVLDALAHASAPQHVLWIDANAEVRSPFALSTIHARLTTDGYFYTTAGHRFPTPKVVRPTTLGHMRCALELASRIEVTTALMGFRRTKGRVDETDARGALALDALRVASECCMNATCLWPLDAVGNTNQRRDQSVMNAALCKVWPAVPAPAADESQVLQPQVHVGREWWAWNGQDTMIPEEDPTSWSPHMMIFSRRAHPEKPYAGFA